MWKEIILQLHRIDINVDVAALLLPSDVNNLQASFYLEKVYHPCNMYSFLPYQNCCTSERETFTMHVNLGYNRFNAIGIFNFFLDIWFSLSQSQQAAAQRP